MYQFAVTMSRNRMCCSTEKIQDSIFRYHIRIIQA